MNVRAWFQNRQLPLFPAALVILFICLNATAQTDESGSRNTIQGDIIMPNGQRLDHPVIVWLSGNRGEMSTTSNGNGSFVFRQLGGGRFTVRVDAGDAYEQATEVVNIVEIGTSGSMNRLGQVYSVQLRLRPNSGQPIAKGVVSANDPPKAAVDLYNKALESVRDGHRDKAIEQLKAALVIHPTFVAALNGLGVQYMKLGKYDDAIKAFGDGLKITPDSFILHLNSGISFFSLNKHAEAEAQFSAALLKNDASAVAHLYHARALIGLNRLDDAAKDLNRAVEIGGDDAKLAHRYLAGIYMEQGHNVEAVKELELYLKVFPETKETDQIKSLIKELSKKAARE
jgi:Tfp pilus assembly protein PilF